MIDWSTVKEKRVSFFYNGGRNGWWNILVGFAFMPGAGAMYSPKERRAEVRRGNWKIYIYLLWWILSIQGKAY